MLPKLLLELSESKRLAAWVTSNGATRGLARRFVAGEQLEDAIAATGVANEEGLMASLDYLGENVLSEADAQRARDTYLGIFDRLALEKLNPNLSLKLAQRGLDLSEELCQSLVETIVSRAAGYGNFVRIDMEGSAYTHRTIELAKRVRARSEAVGVVVQSYLYRSEQDVTDLLRIGCRIRLCKGAYQEPPEIAFPRKADVDRNYIRLM